MSKHLVIGICGGTGSGKTTLAERIISTLFPERVLVLQQEHYYKDFPHVPVERRVQQNFDHPDSFDTALLVEHVRQLREGQAVERPVFDFTRHERASTTIRLHPSPALIIEGILIFENKSLRDLLDVKIFVDTDADLRFIRRVRRDIRERGRTFDSVVEQYLRTVRPMHLEFVEPSKRWADVIIPDGGHNDVVIDLVAQRIKSLAVSSKSPREP